MCGATLRKGIISANYVMVLYLIIMIILCATVFISSSFLFAFISVPCFQIIPLDSTAPPKIIGRTVSSKLLIIFLVDLDFSGKCHLTKHCLQFGSIQFAFALPLHVKIRAVFSININWGVKLGCILYSCGMYDWSSLVVDSIVLIALEVPIFSFFAAGI